MVIKGQKYEKAARKCLGRNGLAVIFLVWHDRSRYFGRE